MATNPTTYTLISSLLPDIWEMALFYLQHSFVMPQLVTVFNDHMGMQPRKITIYKQTTVTDNLGETADLSSTAFPRELLKTITPKEIGAQHILTDRRVDSDSEMIAVDAARNLGYILGEKVEVDLLGLFDDLTGARVSVPTEDLTLPQLFQARAILEANKIPPPYHIVMHPYQYYSLWSKYTDFAKPADFSVRESAMQRYYVGQIADVMFYVSTAVPMTGNTDDVQKLSITGSPTGGNFKLSFRGKVSGDLAHNISAANMKTALVGITGFAAADVTVTLSSSVYTVTVDSKHGKLPKIVLHSNAFSGGTSPTVAVTQPTEGNRSAHVGIFNSQSLVLDMRRNYRLEPDRDPSLRSTELNATMIYAFDTWRADHGGYVNAAANHPDA